MRSLKEILYEHLVKDLFYKFEGSTKEYFYSENFLVDLDEAIEKNRIEVPFLLDCKKAFLSENSEPSSEIKRALLNYHKETLRDWEKTIIDQRRIIQRKHLRKKIDEYFNNIGKNESLN